MSWERSANTTDLLGEYRPLMEIPRNVLTAVGVYLAAVCEYNRASLLVLNQLVNLIHPPPPNSLCIVTDATLRAYCTAVF